MKNIVFLLAFVIIMSACITVNSSRVEDGEVVFEGQGQGYRGVIRLQVRLNGGIITEIIILESPEDPFVGGAAIEELIETVIFYNSTDVDAISGATESSRGFIEALENATIRP